MCFFGLAYWFIDVKEKKRFTDWGVAFGINAITVFFLKRHNWPIDVPNQI